MALLFWSPAWPDTTNQLELNTIEIPLRINEKDSGEITAIIQPQDGKDSVVGVFSEKLATRLKGSISGDKIQTILRLGSTVTFSELKKLKIPIAFDETNLCIVINIPFEERPISELSVIQPPEDSGAKLVESPGFSTSITPSLQLSTDLNNRPLQAEVNTGTYLNGWGAEMRYQLSPRWRLDSWEIQRDFEDSAVRARLGVLKLPSIRPIPGTVPMLNPPLETTLGLAVGTETLIRPFEVSASTGRARLQLDRPSKVRIWMRERLVASFDLDAGIHELNDFPALEGYHNAKVEIRDDLGSVRVVDTQTIYYSRLIKPGKTHFLTVTGIQGDVTGWVRQGLLSPWTGGAGVSRTYQSQTFWLDSSLGLPWGLLESSISRDWRGRAQATTWTASWMLSGSNAVLGWKKAVSPLESSA